MNSSPFPDVTAQLNKIRWAYWGAYLMEGSDGWYLFSENGEACAGTRCLGSINSWPRGGGPQSRHNIIKTKRGRLSVVWVGDQGIIT